MSWIIGSWPRSQLAYADEDLAGGDDRVGDPAGIVVGAAVEDGSDLQDGVVNLVRARAVGGIPIVGVKLTAKDPAAQAAQRLAQRRVLVRAGKLAQVKRRQQRRVF